MATETDTSDAAVADAPVEEAPVADTPKEDTPIKEEPDKGEPAAKKAKPTPAEDGAANTEQRRLFIGGIPLYFTEDSLGAMFAPFGPIYDVKIIRDKEHGKSKGFAFIAYTTGEAAKKAIAELNGTYIDDRAISVKFRKQDPSREDDISFFSRQQMNKDQTQMDWTCPGCGFNNFGKRENCLRCKDDRPTAGGFNGAAPEWHCDFCLNWVKPDLQICPTCNPHLFPEQEPRGEMGGPSRGGFRGAPERGGLLSRGGFRGAGGGPGGGPGAMRPMMNREPMEEEGGSLLARGGFRGRGGMGPPRGNPMMRGRPGSEMGGPGGPRGPMMGPDGPMRGNPMGMHGHPMGMRGHPMGMRGHPMGMRGHPMDGGPMRGMMGGPRMMGRGGMEGSLLAAGGFRGMRPQGPEGTGEEWYDPNMDPQNGPLKFNASIPIPEKKLSEQARRVKEFRDKIQAEKEEEKMKSLGLVTKQDDEDEPIEINLPGSAGFSSFKNSLQEYLDKARLHHATYTIKKTKPNGEEEPEYEFKTQKLKKEDLLLKQALDKGCSFMCTLEFDGNTISTTVPMTSDKDACQRAAFTALKFLKYIPPNAPFEEEVYKGKKPVIIDENAFTESGNSINKPITSITDETTSAPIEFGWEPRQPMNPITLF